MKKSFWSCLLILLFLFFSCGKLPKNDELDGFWNLVTMQETGKEARDMRGTQRFWAFQLDLLNMKSATEYFSKDYSDVLCRFVRFEDSLKITEIYLHPIADRINADDSLVVQPDASFHRFGIYKAGETFKIERLSPGSMVLVSDSCRLEFRRY